MTSLEDKITVEIEVWKNKFVYCCNIRSGRQSEPSESQRKALEKIASKLSGRAPKSSKNDEEIEEAVDIDLLDNPRVILFDGKVMKKSKSNLLNFLGCLNVSINNQV